MNKSGPIVIVENDEDDQDLMKEIFEQLNVSNELIFFDDGLAALAYLKSNSVFPFLILSDINMPGMDGFELRQIIKAEPLLAKKCIPYLFFTTGATPEAIAHAYSLSVQGIFQKPSEFNEWKSVIEHIMLYWSDCLSPRS